ncbi:MAG: GntR family transcriptional regulator [Planctomycetota bacterium]
MPVNATEKSYNAIVEKIRNGHLRPGDKLTTRALAEEIGVSLSPFREAVTRLACEGIVVQRTGTTTIVRECNPQEFDNLFGLLEIIEAGLNESIAERINPVELNEVHSCVRENSTWLSRLENEPYDSMDRYFVEFHLMEQRFLSAMFKASDNPWLTLLVRNHKRIEQMYARNSLDSREAVIAYCKVILEHREKLVNEIANRKAVAARETTVSKLQKLRKLLLNSQQVTQ